MTAPGAPAVLQRIPCRAATGGDLPTAWARSDQTARRRRRRSPAPTASRSSGTSAAPGSPNAGRGTLPAGSLVGAIALVSRGICTFVVEGRAGARRRRDRRSCSSTTGPARRTDPGAAVAAGGDDRRTSTARACAPCWPTHGGRTPMRVGRAVAGARDRPQRHDHELLVGRPDRVRAHELKPDVAAPGGQILSSTLPRTTRLDVRRLRRHEHGDAARRRRRGAAARAPPRLDDAAGQVGARLDGRRRPGPTRRGRRRRRCCSAAAASSACRGGRPAHLHRPDLALVRRPRRRSGAQRQRGAARPRRRRGRRRGHVAGRARARRRRPPGASLDAAGDRRRPPGGEVELPASHAVARAARPRARTTASSSCGRARVTRRVPYVFLVTRPQLAERAGAAAARSADGRHAQRRRPRRASTAIPPRRSAPPPTTRAADERDGAEHVYVTRVDRPAVNAGVSVLGRRPARDRPVVSRLARRERRAGLRRHAGRTSTT